MLSSVKLGESHTQEVYNHHAHNTLTHTRVLVMLLRQCFKICTIFEQLLEILHFNLKRHSASFARILTEQVLHKQRRSSNKYPPNQPCSQEPSGNEATPGALVSTFIDHFAVNIT